MKWVKRADNPRDAPLRFDEEVNDDLCVRGVMNSPQNMHNNAPRRMHKDKDNDIPTNDFPGLRG